MNCHETRERLSDLLDEALPAPERAEVRLHLEGCPECRRELDQLRATVSLLSRVERPRAPAGFVDRVTATANPVPWYQRLGRRIFFPLPIKLPAQAAAMLLVAVLGVYLLQRTPELRDAALPQVTSPERRLEPSGTTSPAAPAPTAAPEQPAPKQPASAEPATKLTDLRAGKKDAGNVASPAPKAMSEAENTAGGERRIDSPRSTPPSTPEAKQDFKEEADADRLQKAGASPAVQAAPVPAAPPAPAPAESRARSRDSAEGQSGALNQAPPAMAAKRQSAMSSVLGRLYVKNRPAAEQGMADLLTRLGGSETARRQETGATVIEVLVPVARYTDFLSGLATLGSFTPESQPLALPTEPPQFRLSIRVSE